MRVLAAFWRSESDSTEILEKKSDHGSYYSKYAMH